MLEFFDELKQIWGGSPSTEPPSRGVSTDDFDDVNESDETVPEAVPQVESDDADFEDHTKSAVCQSDGDKCFSEGDRPSGSSSKGKKGLQGKKGPPQTLCQN